MNDFKRLADELQRIHDEPSAYNDYAAVLEHAISILTALANACGDEPNSKPVIYGSSDSECITKESYDWQRNGRLRAELDLNEVRDLLNDALHEVQTRHDEVKELKQQLAALQK